MAPLSVDSTSLVGAPTLALPIQTSNIIATHQSNPICEKVTHNCPPVASLRCLDDFSPGPGALKQTQHSSIAKSVMSTPNAGRTSSPREGEQNSSVLGYALTDTPATSAPSSPRLRALTLDIPGLTKSKISPDGRIANRDIGAKLVIVMVGLPARGKSYVTKKLARYLNWLQHDTKIFNVGNRRRIAAGALDNLSHSKAFVGNQEAGSTSIITSVESGTHGTGLLKPNAFASLNVSNPLSHRRASSIQKAIEGGADQSHSFFDPANVAAAELREKVAMETLDELLNYVLYEGGSVGILDATNSTLERRKVVLDRVRQVAGKDLGVVFLESECYDEKLLEANMRLKLSGPDYKGQDPVKALEDFKKRVAIYQKSYVPVGDFEERAGMQYIKMIDVGRKIVTHQIRGFLAAQTVSFLLNFHLADRQIWITRHGESLDNVSGKIGGDAPLSDLGRRYAKALAIFIDFQRKHFRQRQLHKHSSAHMPPQSGDATPPNPEYSTTSDENGGQPIERSFCVWTSMLRRSIETAQYIDEEEYDVKQMRMLNELNAGIAEGMTYDEIRKKWPDQYAMRRAEKLNYRYPGAGGESYLDVINRLRAVIVEVERMSDHVLLIVHRVVARVLLAYFLGLDRNDVAKLDVPLGMLYVLEPKPYGVEFRAYKYDSEREWFNIQPDYQLKNEEQKDVKVSIKMTN